MEREIFYIKFNLISIFLILLFLSSPSDSDGIINFFKVNSKEILKPGDTISFTVNGTASGHVWVEIPGLPLKIYLTETSCGVYKGTYKVSLETPGICRASLISHMEMNGEFCSPVTAQNKITVLGKNPMFYKLMPSEGIIISDKKPVISAAIYGATGKVDKNSLKILINRHDVTKDSGIKISSEYIIFKPSYDFKEGEYIVYLYGKTTDGHDFCAEWNFFIRLSTVITSHNALRELNSGDILEVHILGEPYQKAYFDIGEWKKGLSAHESFRTPGLYIGYYSVQKGDYVVNAPLTGYLISSSGETLKSPADRLISITANELLLKIAQPKDGDFVASQFVVSGQTRPFTAVHIELKIICNLPGMGPVDGGIIGEDIKSNQSGVFEYKVKAGNQLPGSEYIVTVIARDAQGNKSTPGIIKVYQK
jgi:hypothetical protein